MLEAEARLEELGIVLPDAHAPVGNYLGAVRVGDLIFVSGHGPASEGTFIHTGKVDSEVSLDEAYQAARLAMLNCLRSLKDEIGSLNRLRRVIKLLGMVNSDPSFGLQPEVIDGASDLLVDLFGERGRHARSAVGLGALPRNISVEIEMIVEVEG